MNRQTGILAALAVVLVAALFYFFVWQPKDAEIAEIEEQIASAEQQQQQLERQIRELQEVRTNAPELEAAIVAAESVVPRDIGQASAIRQLQLAADGSGVDLPSVSFSEPAQLENAPAGLAELTISVQVQGGYYQIVDFYRRVEDPAITPRGVVWRDLSVSASDYPTLSATTSGSIFALLPTPPEPEPTEDETPADGADEEDAEAEEAAA